MRSRDVNSIDMVTKGASTPKMMSLALARSKGVRELGRRGGGRELGGGRKRSGRGGQSFGRTGGNSSKTEMFQGGTDRTNSRFSKTAGCADRDA